MRRLWQDQDTLIALYSIAPGTRFPHINGFFSKDLSEITADKSGWIFMRGGTSTYIACRPLQPYRWKEHRLFSPWLHNGVIVQAAAASEFPSLREFGKAIVSLPLQFRLDPMPSVKFKSLRGTLIEFTFGETPKLNGAPIDYQHWPLFGGRFLHSDIDSEVLIMTYGTMKRTLDFKQLTVDHNN